MTMVSFDLFSIGHSNVAFVRFAELLRTAGVNAIADVRSTPVSRRFPWFSGRALAERLGQEGVDYAMACSSLDRKSDSRQRIAVAPTPALIGAR